jgi:hypothetical protein
MTFDRSWLVIGLRRLLICRLVICLSLAELFVSLCLTLLIYRFDGTKSTYKKKKGKNIFWQCYSNKKARRDGGRGAVAGGGLVI